LRPPVYMLAIPPLASLILIGVLSLMFSACYTLKQGLAMLSLFNKAVPLEKLETDGSAADKLFVERVRDIKNFATELGLKQTKNYTSYIAIDRNYLVAVVQACANDSFNTYYWHYPIVGKLPYKGFFNAKDAKKEAEKLKRKNLDVLVRPVDAFSTLGFFKDPLYSFMKDYSPYRLADLIIHESTHATIFIRGNADYNEELAEFIGTEGGRLYIESRFGKDSKEYADMLASEEDSDAFINSIKSLTAELDAFYKKAAADNMSKDDILAQKEKIISDFQKKFAADYASTFRSDHYKSFSTMHINNAYLSLYMLYHGNKYNFRQLYLECGSDLKKFIEEVKRVPPESLLGD